MSSPLLMIYQYLRYVWKNIIILIILITIAAIIGENIIHHDQSIIFVNFKTKNINHIHKNLVSILIFILDLFIVYTIQIISFNITQQIIQCIEYFNSAINNPRVQLFICIIQYENRNSSFFSYTNFNRRTN